MSYNYMYKEMKITVTSTDLCYHLKDHFCNVCFINIINLLECIVFM